MSRFGGRRGELRHGLLALLVLGCAFESGSSPVPGVQDDPDALPETSSSSSSGTAPPASTTSGSAEEEGTSEPSPTSGMPQGQTSSGPEAGGSSGSSSSEGGESETTGPMVDCSEPKTMSLVAADAGLVAPMELGEHLGVTYAFSSAADAGEARFTFDVKCPSMYRLFGRVRDDVPGTSGCCDPDSFAIEGPDGLDVSWFYGCDSSTSGWNWLRIEAGEQGLSCDGTQPLLVPLSVGTHVFTLRNRESNYFEAVAGVAELVLTNDPEFVP